MILYCRIGVSGVRWSSGSTLVYQGMNTNAYKVTELPITACSICVAFTVVRIGND